MVHTFKCLGQCYVLDVESGSLFKTDELINSIIESYNSPELKSGEFSCYTESEIMGAKNEIEELIKEGVLFSKEPEHRKLEFDGVVKSMCLNISHKCNMRCAYCFADGGSYAGSQENMPFKTAKAAVDFLVKKSGGRKTLEIDFFGGEPLLNFDVVKKTVEYGRSIEKKVNKTFRFTLTTNALCLTDEISDFFNKEMYNVVLSIDGRENVHNYLRKTVGGKRTHDIVLKNALDFVKKREDKQYYVRGTFTSRNCDFSLDALALSDYGFDQISLEPVVLDEKNPLSIKEQDLKLICDEYEKLSKAYVERRKNGKWFNFFHFNIDLENGPCETKRLKSCGAGCEYVAVTPSGDMYPCHQFAGNREYFLGNVLEDTYFEDVSARFNKNNVLEKKECGSCFAKYFCSGGCAANAVNFNGDMTNPVKISCAMMKKRVECALAIYETERL